MAAGRFDGWEIEDLIAAVAVEDRDAFAELYRRTSAKLYAVMFRILGEAARTDDAVHDCYVRVWRSASTYDAGRGKPITWLATMARNMAIDVRRREMEIELAGNHQQAVSHDFCFHPPHVHSPEVHVVGVDLCVAVETCRAGLVALLSGR